MKDKFIKINYVLYQVHACFSQAKLEALSIFFPDALNILSLAKAWYFVISLTTYADTHDFQDLVPGRITPGLINQKDMDFC